MMRLFRAGAVAVAVAVTPIAAAWSASESWPSWYPQECRHYSDCLPVETMTGLFLADEARLQLVVTSKRGTAVVPAGLPVQQSRDSRMHVCMQYDAFGAMEATCLLLPPGT
jgi:hypothetical protein